MFGALSFSEQFGPGSLCAPPVVFASFSPTSGWPWSCFFVCHLMTQLEGICKILLFFCFFLSILIYVLRTYTWLYPPCKCKSIGNIEKLGPGTKSKVQVQRRSLGPKHFTKFGLHTTRSIVEVPIELQKHDILKVSQNKIWVLRL